MANQGLVDSINEIRNLSDTLYQNTVPEFWKRLMPTSTMPVFGRSTISSPIPTPTSAASVPNWSATVIS